MVCVDTSWDNEKVYAYISMDPFILTLHKIVISYEKLDLKPGKDYNLEKIEFDNIAHVLIHVHELDRSYIENVHILLSEDYVMFNLKELQMMLIPELMI